MPQASSREHHNHLMSVSAPHTHSGSKCRRFPVRKALVHSAAGAHTIPLSMTRCSLQALASCCVEVFNLRPCGRRIESPTVNVDQLIPPKKFATSLTPSK